MPFLLLVGIFKLYKLMKTKKINLVHTYLFQANVIGRISAKIAGIKAVVCSIRGMETGFQFFIEKKTAFMANKFIVNSIALENLIEKKMNLTKDKIVVIYNGIEPDTIKNVGRHAKLKELDMQNSENHILIGTSGRLHKEKGILYLIEAFRLVKNHHENVKCIIVGDGPQRDELELRIKDLGLENDVCLLGFRPDSIDIISILDIFVLSSPYEGMPNAILEAMACGRKIVATAVGGINELIENNVSGLTVEKNNPADLADAILFMINNDSRAVQMSVKAKDKIKSFSMKNMIDNTCMVYDRMLGKVPQVAN